MKKVLTFSLWGSIPKYTIGAIKNAQQFLDFYPEFESWFYVHEETVPKEIIKQLSHQPKTIVILKSGDLEKMKPEMWRFEAIDDPNVEVMMPRDTDTRILHREKLAVQEWLSSSKLFHIMRDNPYHGHFIMAGMFGTRKIPEIPCWNELIHNFENDWKKGYDQEFLKQFIYPNIIGNCMIHASFHKFENDTCLDFPISHEKDDYKFVGEYIYEDDSRDLNFINNLKNALNHS